MDPFTHSLVGLTVAKGGLGRWSPLATTVCVIAANAPDCDLVVGLVSDRWNYLHHHRGITHSIVGVLALGILLPSIVYGADRLIARVRHRVPRVRYRGLLVASLIVTATHPLMDWTNNYGVRPFLPWSAQWFYGDLVFVVDPYILLALGGAAFLTTSNRWPKIALWSLFAAAIIVLSFVVPSRPDPNQISVSVVRMVLLVGILLFVITRIFRLGKGREKQIALAVLALIIFYWGTLALVHQAAHKEATDLSARVAAQMNERFVRVATMPMLANPFRWACVAETDQAIYRFTVRTVTNTPTDLRSIVDAYRADSSTGIERYEKPNERAAGIAALASRDRRAGILLGFARFPIARVEDENCISRTLVQFADLRYTQPGSARGAFSVNVPVECPPH
jgi:inner membrane protein